MLTQTGCSFMWIPGGVLTELMHDLKWVASNVNKCELVYLYNYFLC